MKNRCAICGVERKRLLSVCDECACDELTGECEIVTEAINEIALLRSELERARDEAKQNERCDHCGDSPVAWTCRRCRYVMCADCQFTQMDCYDGDSRACPSCGLVSEEEPKP